METLLLVLSILDILISDRSLYERKNKRYERKIKKIQFQR